MPDACAAPHHNGERGDRRPLLLAALARRFRMHLVGPEEVTPLPSITLRPRETVRVVLEERPGESFDPQPCGR